MYHAGVAPATALASLGRIGRDQEPLRRLLRLGLSAGGLAGIASFAVWSGRFGYDELVGDARSLPVVGLLPRQRRSWRRSAIKGRPGNMHASSPSNHGAGDARTQRLNMVESQVRPSDVTDRRILRAMSDVPREAFVPVQHRAVAYMDNAVPLVLSAQGHVQRAMLPPRTLAKMIQNSEIESTHSVLNVGAATGYTAALLAQLARKVVALESDPALAERAKATLAAAKISNVTVVTGPLTAGSRNDGPFDAILIDGAVPDVPQDLLDQLKEGGRLVAIVGNGSLGKVTVWIRSHGTYTAREVFDAAAGVLPGLERKAAFTF